MPGLGILPHQTGAQSYTIFQIGSVTYAFNQTTQVIEFGDADAGPVWRAVMAVLQASDTGGKVSVRVGIYNVDSLVEYTTGVVNPTWYGMAVVDGTNIPIAFDGETGGALPYDWVSAGVPHGGELPLSGVIFNITTTATTMAGSSYCVGIGDVGPTWNSNAVDYRNIRVRFPTNQRGSVTGWSHRFVQDYYMENCGADFHIATADLLVATSSGERSLGIETPDGLEGLIELDRCFVIGYYEGFSFNGEHIYALHCEALCCVYAASFCFRGVGAGHPTILDNFHEAHCLRGPRWSTGNVPGGMFYDLRNYDLEIAVVGTIWEKIAYASETADGICFKGNVTYSVTQSGVGPIFHNFWETGSGRSSVTRNAWMGYMDYALTLADHYTNAGNVTTGKTTLYTDMFVAGRLQDNGDKIDANYGGIFVGHVTATRQVTVELAGTTILDTTALVSLANSSWTIQVDAIRVSSSVLRYAVTMIAPGLTTVSFASSGELTGLVLANTFALAVTGQAGATGAATNDIVAKSGTVKFVTAAF